MSGGVSVRSLNAEKKKSSALIAALKEKYERENKHAKKSKAYSNRRQRPVKGTGQG